MAKVIPVRKTKCATCPFRVGSPHSDLAESLADSALNDASRICHSTGRSAIYHRTGKPQRICRGTRDIQLRYFVLLGYLKEPTDAAWAAKLAEIKKRKVDAGRRVRHPQE